MECYYECCKCGDIKDDDGACPECGCEDCLKKNKAEIVFLGQEVTVTCDRNCKKAWGVSNRPIRADGRFLSDKDLKTAPADPGTYEGGDAKPPSPDNFPNRWCVRECERCVQVTGHHSDDDFRDLFPRRFKEWTSS